MTILLCPIAQVFVLTRRFGTSAGCFVARFIAPGARAVRHFVPPIPSISKVVESLGELYTLVLHLFNVLSWVMLA